MPEADEIDLTDPKVEPLDEREVTDPLAVNDLLGGRYAITRRLARGGMSVVYLAHQVDLARPVALKILRPPSDVRDQYDFASWFQAEARTLAGFSHPNVVTLYDYGPMGEAGANGFFLAMEYVDGPSLSELLRRGPLDPQQAVGYLIQVCRALRYAHQRGVVHCDMKPSNVLIAEDDEGRDVVKVIDFGIAEVERGGRAAVDAPLLGSPQSMAPEQIRGERVTPATDIYGVGTLFVKCLTGRMPFKGATPRETLDLQLHAAPPTLAELAPGRTFSPALEEIARRCLAKVAEDRFPDMDALLAALRAARPVSDEELTGSLVLPPPARPAPAPAAGPRVSTGPWLAVGGAAIVLALGAAAWLLGLATAPADAPPTAVAEPLAPLPPIQARPAGSVEPPPEPPAPQAEDAPPEPKPARAPAAERRPAPDRAERPEPRPAEPPKPREPERPAAETKKPDGYMDMPDF